jgi:hypothetical protein
MSSMAEMRCEQVTKPRLQQILAATVLVHVSVRPGSGQKSPNGAATGSTK